MSMEEAESQIRKTDKAIGGDKMNTNLNMDVYHADVYLRLSKEDGDKEESNSITNQREFVLEFLKYKKDIRIHAVRVDDGYSGVNFVEVR